MKTICLLACFASFSLSSIGQRSEFDYFGITTPGDSVKLFAPGFVSFQNVKEKSLAVSPDGDELFFSGGKTWPETKIMHVKKINNKWTKPKIAEFSIDCYATEPAFSTDGKYLYYSSSKGMTDIKQYSIWRVEKDANGWGVPEKIIDINDPEIWEFHPSVTKGGDVYFCRWDSVNQVGSIYKSEYSNGVYTEPQRVNLLFIKQSSNTDPFIDPEGKYIITSSAGQNDKGDYDVYISYKKDDGSWFAPVNFGDKFNTEGDDDSFDISPDNRFLFIYKQDDVFWTEIKGVLDNLKKSIADKGNK